MVSNARRNGFAPFAGIALAFLLAGCASTFDALPEKLGGLPSNAPARPAETAPYLNVYEPAHDRDVKPLTAEEQKKLGSDLMALRESQTLRANPPPPPAKLKAAEKKPRGKKPVEIKAAAKKATDKKPIDIKPN